MIQLPIEVTNAYDCIEDINTVTEELYWRTWSKLFPDYGFIIEEFCQGWSATVYESYAGSTINTFQGNNLLAVLHIGELLVAQFESKLQDDDLPRGSGRGEK